MVSAYPYLISLQQAKSQCRVMGMDDDEVINRYRKMGQKIVIDYCKKADTYWNTPSGSPEVGIGLPPHVEAAMLLVIEALYTGEDPLSDAVMALLERSRDPALA